MIYLLVSISLIKHQGNLWTLTISIITVIIIIIKIIIMIIVMMIRMNFNSNELIHKR